MNPVIQVANVAVTEQQRGAQEAAIFLGFALILCVCVFIGAALRNQRIAAFVMFAVAVVLFLFFVLAISQS